MKPVQIVLDEPLLRAVDHAARKAKQNRSALVRDALRRHLDRLRVQELERQHREGYRRHPPVEFEIWDKVALWPED